MTNAQNATNYANAYQQAFFEAQKLIAAIEDGLEKHAERQSTEARNWGFIGDLESLNAALRDAAERIGVTA